MDRVVQCRCNSTTAKITKYRDLMDCMVLIRKLDRGEQALGFSLLTAEAGW
jgi:hypothetical protein